MRRFFKDRLLAVSVIILVLIVAVVLFTTYSDFPMQHPLAGVFIYAMIPVLFFSGAVAFVVDIFRS